MEDDFDWAAVRDQFALRRDRVHIGLSQFLASHPAPVRAAIEAHRAALDADPIIYVRQNEQRLLAEARAAAAEDLGVSPDGIALTDSTTMALGLLYHGLELRPGDEILTTPHEYYSHREAIRLAARRSGATVRSVALYEAPEAATADEMVARVAAAIRPQTRVVALTWVHSGTGVKLPIARIASVLAQRVSSERILFCVDGVHGFGVETETLAELGCDFLATGCHKWLYGPRGTGLLAGRESAWRSIRPTIPSFSPPPVRAWLEGSDADGNVSGPQVSPGGFHAFEHLWAIREAFAFRASIGRDRVRARVRALNGRCKEALDRMSHVRLHTPKDPECSSGITCFEVLGRPAQEIVDTLRDRGILATAAPYRPSYVRFTPGIINSFEDLDAALAAVESLGDAEGARS